MRMADADINEYVAFVSREIAKLGEQTSSGDDRRSLVDVQADSLSILRLAGAIEDHYDVAVDIVDLSPPRPLTNSVG
jgi:acyl carrier protein